MPSFLRMLLTVSVGCAPLAIHFLAFSASILISITKGLVQNPDAISVDVSEPDEEGVIVYHLHVAEEDMGRVIGKQGRIAKAIRVVMRAAATRNDAKISVEID